MLVANGVTVRIDSRDDFTPTPVVSQAILTHNRAADGTQRFTGEGLADGIVVTPSNTQPAEASAFGITFSEISRFPKQCCLDRIGCKEKKGKQDGWLTCIADHHCNRWS